MHTVASLLIGDLSPSQRILTAMAPALALVAYFVVGLIIYTIRYAVRGPYRDREFESRGSSVLMNMWIRQYFAWIMQPLWRLVLRSGLPPMAITTLSVLLAFGSGVSLAAGRFALGGWLYIFAGICDIIDGRLARARNLVTKSGGALDSILDRYSDSAVLIGLAWYYRDSWVLIPTLLALMGSALVPYIRARGEATGITVKVGVMQRAERILYLGVGCALSPAVEAFVAPEQAHPLHRLAVVGIVLLAGATHLTALQRFAHVMRALGEAPPAAWLRKTGLPVSHVIAAAAVATAVDFALVNVLVLMGWMGPPAATGIGAVFGGIVNFGIYRVRTVARRAPRRTTLKRYSFVSLTSAALNAGGVAVLLLLPSIDFRIDWVVVRAAVFLAWNFPLHKDYVFGREGPDGSMDGARAG